MGISCPLGAQQWDRVTVASAYILCHKGAQMRTCLSILGVLILAIACTTSSSEPARDPVPPEGIYQGSSMPHGVNSVRILPSSTKGHPEKIPEPVLCFDTIFKSEPTCYELVEWLPETPFQPAHAKFQTQLFGTWFWVPGESNLLQYRQGSASANFYPGTGSWEDTIPYEVPRPTPVGDADVWVSFTNDEELNLRVRADVSFDVARYDLSILTDTYEFHLNDRYWPADGGFHFVTNGFYFEPWNHQDVRYILVKYQGQALDCNRSPLSDAEETLFSCTR